MNKTGFVQVDIYNRLIGVDCILAYETAADYLCLSNMCSERKAYHIYTTTELNQDDLDCIIVDSLDTIPYILKNNIRVTTEEQTIIDLLRNNRDEQVIQESMSYWYETHNQSFNGLNVPNDIVEVFNSFKEDAIHYYDN